MKILVTGFTPFGIKGFIFNRNESQEIALKLKEKYGFEVIILPVDDSCVSLLRKKIKEYKPEVIISLGQGDGFRIETRCTRKNRELSSNIAKEIKDYFGFTEEKIGEWYCNDVYFESLSKVQNTFFIHVPLFTPFKKVDKIIEYGMQIL